MTIAGARILFAGTIFTSAFLLFLVQPLIAKQILPWFGGSAAVWSICMVFFQVVLLAGYAYSDWITRHLRMRAQALLHVALLLASLAFLPIVTSARWKPAGAEDPTLWILGLLVATIGLPYFLLSTTGPLVQSWVARTPWGAQVYRYFSLSNLASLASLLAYPVLIEPYSALVQQAWGWSVGYGAVRAAVRRHGDLRGAPLGRRSRCRTGGRRRPAAASNGGRRAARRRLPAVARAAGARLLAAAGDHQPHHAERGGHPVPLGAAAVGLPADLRAVLRERPLVPPRRLFLPLAAVMLALCAFGLQDSLGSDVKTGAPDLHRRPVRAVHVPARRDGATAARRRASSRASI